ncbi:hypothetical protein PBRA_001969 [Plasmodiophora brassicae]|uniref:V-type proton ATPase subunit a n=1 Tax=Plasmodiophora brassicae TaxID=37360 RepID=A0A0G4J163_PLABS|nr:hypothetical protein PBRA_001969 [Plasmodiophora brassicae]
MGLWRSSRVTRVQLAVDEASASTTLAALDGLVHLIDLNRGEVVVPEFAMGWKRRAMACGGLMARLDAIGKLMVDYDVVLPDLLHHDDAMATIETCDSIQTKLLAVETDLKHHTDVLVHLESDIERLLERVSVLALCQAIDQNERTADLVDIRQHSGESGGTLSRVCGCITQADRAHLERMIFRASRGNAHALFDLDRPVQTENLLENMNGRSKRQPQSRRVAFCVFVVGRLMELKVRHLVSLVGALHEVQSSESWSSEIQEVIDEIRDAVEVVRATRNHITTLLETVADSSFQSWRASLRRELAISQAMQRCRTLNHSNSKTIRIEGWVFDIDLVRSSLSRTAHDLGIPPAALHVLNHSGDDIIPPTHFHLNEFTSIFQKMINTYGVPRYQEVNPAVFTIVTFPFMFGQMFGDVGHGSIIFLCGLYLVFRGRSLPPQYADLYKARYLIAMMGFFAIYFGLIYNDMLGFGVPLFESGWSPGPDGLKHGSVYPLGIDPAWHGADNELQLMNSIKMKISIVTGIIHMTVGICLSAVNHKTFQDRDALLCEFIPQMLFLWATFGYMAFLIIFKACYSWDGLVAPSIIQTTINLFVGSPYDPMFRYQSVLHVFLRLVAFVSVPVMLFGKPYLRWRRLKTATVAYRQVDMGDLDIEVELQPLASSQVSPPVASSYSTTVESADAVSPKPTRRDRADEAIAESLLHQAIHTIEFVLGAVSNTASYLRLWALSLAHAQLSLVFLEHILIPSWSSSSVIVNGTGFCIWLGSTLGILCGMDCLECLLHALRLHWVEFQSKFFKADGVEFEAFSLSADWTRTE